MRKKRTLTPEQIAQYNQIPAVMRERPQWVCYTLEPGKDGAITKIPREPKTGARAKINDPSGWVTFDEALARVERYDGLEYMLIKDDPFTFIDLDHCIDINTGEISAEAQRIINRFDSYTEESQSGTGIHIIGIGAKPGPRCRTNSTPGVEIYDDVRPIVMTGKIIQNRITIEKCGNEINGLYYDLFGDAEAELLKYDQSLPVDAPESSVSTHYLSDAELIEKACSSPKNGTSFCHLWNGNLSEYNGDWSAADQALCNHLAWWTNRDFDRIDHLFRKSGLMRDKWEKREDYRRRTINKAIRDTSGGYTGRGKPKANSNNNGGKTQGNRKPKPTTRTPENTSNYGDLAYLTDLGNAEYLINCYGEDLRYDVDSGRWLYWSGTHWHRDDTGHIDRLARKAIRNLYDVLKTIHDPDRSKKLFSHILKSESRPRLEAMIAMARYCPGIPVKTADLDADHWLLNCANGTLDLRTSKLRPHSQSDLISKILPINYNPQAKCPRWEQFLREVFMNDAGLIDFVQRMVGYCLTGDTREESVFILYGRGQCGKSKFVEVLRHILADYTRDTPVTTFLERNDTNTADLASLVGARLVTASETEGDHQTFNEPLLKKISGRDPVTCRFLYRDFFTYIPTYKVVFATNDPPRIRSQGFAMKRRIKVIPFKQRFNDPDTGILPIKDDRLQEKLFAESEGILAWAVRGCLKWQKDGLPIPSTIRREINNLFDSQDPLAEFIDSQCVLDPDALIEIRELWKRYWNWCDEVKLRPAFKATQWFSKNLAQRDGIETVRGVNGVRMLRGITLANDANDANRGMFSKVPHEGIDSGNLPEHGQIASFASPEPETERETPWYLSSDSSDTLDLDDTEGEVEI